VREKGICYGVGLEGSPTLILDAFIERDFEIIRRELGCTAIRLFGADDSRILKCANIAIEKGFNTVLLSPRYLNHTPEATVEKLSKFASDVNSLDNTRSLVLSVGNELTVDARGIYESDNYLDRTYEVETKQHDEKCQKKLEELLRSLIATARRHTDVRLTYTAGSWEWMMPWNDLDLDILGDNHYWYGGYGKPDDPENMWFRHVRPYEEYGKPYFITEFGTGLWGGFDLGGAAWRGGATVLVADDEPQAVGTGKYMEMFNKADELGLAMDGCFLFDCYNNCYGIIKPGDPFVVGPKPRKAFYMYKSYERAA